MRIIVKAQWKISDSMSHAIGRRAAHECLPARAGSPGVMTTKARSHEESWTLAMRAAIALSEGGP
jgi:hypothetical protein